MKILMVGLGSIGQRHLRNLRKLYGEDLEILAYRVRRQKTTFDDKLQIRSGVDVEKEFHIRVFSELEEALKEKPEIVFITNITAKHVECALKAARAGCDLFLEKPLSDSMAGIDELLRLVKEKQIVAYVGFQNRFHPCIQDAKEVLRDKKLGKIISVTSEFSERLSTMHRYENYKGTYMARKEMGGGPILNLQIHCLDYLQWLLGEPVSVYSIAEHNTGLEIDVEDYAASLYQFRNEEGTLFPVYTYTDFLQYPPVHTLKIAGEEGRMELDLNHAATRVILNGEAVIEYTHPEFERNGMFLCELEDFMKCVRERANPQSSIEQGIISLKMALAAKESAKEKRAVLIKEIKG